MMNTDGIIGHKLQIKKLETLLNGNKIPGALMFSGKDGIGKSIIARRFAGAILCDSNNPPCMTCSSCISLNNNTHPDFIQLDPNEKGVIPIGDAGKRETGSVRWFIERLTMKPLTGRSCVIINGIDKISREGETALLKSIEEPVNGTYILLITSSRSKILPTILSRCTEIAFSELSHNELNSVLELTEAGCNDSEFVSNISGGSADIALKLADDDILNNISVVCAEISAYLTKGGRLTLDLSPFNNRLNMENFIDIMLNIYRLILISKLKSTELNSSLLVFSIDDTVKLRKLIKIFLALRTGFEINLNIRYCLKGMLYSLENINEIERPSIDFSFLNKQ